MAYTKPEDVVGEDRWELIRVLFDGRKNGISYAIGKWGGKLALGARWNYGRDTKELGVPTFLDSDQKSEHSTWFIMEDDHQRVKAMLEKFEEERKHQNPEKKEENGLSNAG